MKTKRQSWTPGPLARPTFRGESARGPTPGHAKDRPLLTAAELAEWVERAKSLPDLRWEKVQAIREALRNHEYDVDSRLHELCRHLREEWPGLVPGGE